MPIMSKNQKYLVMLALLAGAAPAAVVAQDQAQDAPPATASADDGPVATAAPRKHLPMRWRSSSD